MLTNSSRPCSIDVKASKPSRTGLPFSRITIRENSKKSSRASVAWRASPIALKDSHPVRIEPWGGDDQVPPLERILAEQDGEQLEVALVSRQGEFQISEFFQERGIHSTFNKVSAELIILVAAARSALPTGL